MLTERRGVEQPGAQGTGDRATPFGELEASQVDMQPGTPTRSGALRVGDGEHSAGIVPDHPQEDGPEAAFSASHARAHRTLGRALGTNGEPGAWPSRSESSALGHEA